MEKIVIYGASGHGKVVCEALREEGNYEIAGFLDDRKTASKGELFNGFPVLGGGESLPDLRKNGIRWAIVAVGEGKMRLDIAGLLVKAGFLLATAIHPSARLARDVLPGAGSVVAPGAILNPGSRIGENVIINSGAIIEHDCVIGEGAHICPGVCLAGGVQVGRLAWVGLGSRVIQNVRIGDAAVIGAGAVVLNDIPAGATAVGIPARVQPAKAP
ncbi:MAG: acetyltransferase [bacterium]